MTKAEFFDGMLTLLPEAQAPCQQMRREYGDFLETVVLEDAFFPLIQELLAKRRNEMRLRSIFNLLERAVDGGDADLTNLISVTILECLGNDTEVLKEAGKYMGPHTCRLQLEADRALGRKL